MAATTQRKGTVQADERVLRITRVFNAPRDLVYRVWTEPEHLTHWWGPKDFVVRSYDLDVRPGGRWHACIESPKGEVYRHEGVYGEVTPPERLVFSHAWVYEDGRRSIETEVTVTFVDLGNRTEVRFEQGVFDTAENCRNHFGGWSECLDNLTAYLARPQRS